ncbi:MAG: hypothetical protein KBD00_04790 [Candidatus Peribacteraceae bacterium]|nr:hypothetical protein [Candidatus Peribacteraceae bacterium]
MQKTAYVLAACKQCIDMLKQQASVAKQDEKFLSGTHVLVREHDHFLFCFILQNELMIAEYPISILGNNQPSLPCVMKHRPTRQHRGAVSCIHVLSRYLGEELSLEQAEGAQTYFKRLEDCLK